MSTYSGAAEFSYIESLKDRIAELEKIVDVMYADGNKNDARVMRYKAIASKAIREQVAIREEYKPTIDRLEKDVAYFKKLWGDEVFKVSILKDALLPFLEEYKGWSEDDYKYVPANVLRGRRAIDSLKDDK